MKFITIQATGETSMDEFYIDISIYVCVYALTHV